MWVTVMVMADRSVIVRPDNPGQSTEDYLAGREGLVFEHRVEVRDCLPGDVLWNLEGAMTAITSAYDSAPLNPVEVSDE